MSTCATRAGKPLVIVHTCRSCTSTTSGRDTTAWPPLAARPGEEAGGGQVHRDAHEGDHEHDAAVHVGRVDEPVDRA
jgi:hypothetical protein